MKLSDLMEAWPLEIKSEIERLGLGASSVNLPSSLLSAGLRQGKVQFTWRALLQAIPEACGVDSSLAETALDLPLKIVAPVFLNSRRSASVPKRNAAMDSMPDLFFGGAKPVAPAPQPASPPPAAPNPPAPPARSAFSESATSTRLAVKTPSPQPANPPNQQPAPAPQAAPALPVPTQAQPAGSGNTVQILSAPVSVLDETWTEAVKSEIAKLNVPGLRIELPMEEIGAALKAGKVEYPWRQIRAWLRPPIPETTAAQFNEEPLSLPLRVLAPL